MPTTHWIQETAADRFWEARAVPYVRRPVVFSCAICDEPFGSADERSWHANEAHPLARPTLYISDLAAPSMLTVRSPLAPESVSIASCTSVDIELDGATATPVEPKAVGPLLTGKQAGHVVLRLENQRAADGADVRADYTIEIAIPDREELAEVDRAFVRHLAIDGPSTRDIESFASDVAGLVSARAYAGALADYVHGVLVKEGSEAGGTTLPFEAFHAKFSRALQELRDHEDRPVAASVVALAKLNLNDVRGATASSGDPTVDGCLRALRAVATLEPVEPERERTGTPMPLCPVDRDTHLVLTACRELVLDGTGRADPFEERADDGALSPQDRTKLRVLLALHALRAGRRADASRYLDVLRHDADFGAWAERELERAA